MKLDSLSKAEGDAACDLLDSFSNAIEARDANTVNALYTEAQQNYHAQMGASGMLALKRCGDLVRKLT